MAPKKPSRLVDNPPSASPSQDHEEEEAELLEEEEDFQVEEKGKTSQKPQKSQNPQKPKPTDDQSVEEEEEGSGFESDDNTKSSPTASDFTIKPIVPPTTASKNPHRKEPEKPTAKRALEVQKADEKKDSRRAKKNKVVEEDGEDNAKKSVTASGRVWREEDEIAVLEGMIDYREEKGADPHADMGAFLEFVKGRFGFEVSRTQLYEKVRRLKKKFFNNLEKYQNGDDTVLTKDHEKECFDLSEKIWGASTGIENVSKASNGISNGVDTANVKSNDGKAKKSDKIKSSKKDEKKKKEEYKKNVEEKKKSEEDEKMIVEEEEVKDEGTKGNEGDFGLKYPNLIESFNLEISPFTSMPESQRNYIIEHISSLDSEKARELDESWKKLWMKETEFHCQRLELMTVQTRLVLDAMQKR